MKLEMLGVLGFAINAFYLAIATPTEVSVISHFGVFPCVLLIAWLGFIFYTIEYVEDELGGTE